MEPVADACRLRCEIVAGLDQELELAAGVIEPDRRQLGLPEGDAGDRQGITGITLAGSPRAEPLPVAELGWDLDRRQPRGQQEAGRRRAIASGALEADAADATDLAEPGCELHEPGWVVRKGLLVEDLPDVVDRARRERRLVGVDPHHAHRQPLSSLRYDGRGPGGQMCVEVTATLL